jgi:hypothetical protein
VKRAKATRAAYKQVSKPLTCQDFQNSLQVTPAPNPSQVLTAYAVCASLHICFYGPISLLSYAHPEF